MCRLNRLLPLLVLAALCGGLRTAAAQATETLYLSGVDKDHTVDWEFMATGGRKSGRWATLPAPSNWEFHGFGTYNYGHDKPRADERGLYRRRFDVPAAWRGRNVQIVFEGVMTDAEVKINGALAGPVHQGAFYQFRYDITNLLRFGRSNLIEVAVSKESANESVNEAERQADFWVFGGIFRPVYLEARPAYSVQRVAIDARADGAFRMDVFLNEPAGRRGPARLSAHVETMDGRPVGRPFEAEVAPGEAPTALGATLGGIAPWSPEFPHRYRVVATLYDEGRPAHTIRQTFGFRTVDLRPRDGLYVNGVRVHLKGVNHHSFWPETGRTLSPEISVLDVNLIKDMNMNAVRMSHYPPDQHFLEACDSLGLFVLDELTGWQDAYDTEVGSKLVRELVLRDVNHPSVILWDNGNEGGFNYELADDYARYDPQARPVIHPWENEVGKINTTHYRGYDCCAGKFFNGRDIFMPTEFLHGLYDGGHGAGLEDMWNRMLLNPLAGGAFLWVFADEGIVRTDRADSIDTDGNHAPDGLLGPHREKEASYYAVRQTWAPVHIPLPHLAPSFSGDVPVENRFYYTNLNQCAFRWSLVDYPAPGAPGARRVAASGAAPAPDAAPWQRATLRLPLPEGWRRHDALYLTATDPHGREIYTWSWPIAAAEHALAQTAAPGGGGASGGVEGGRIVLRGGSAEVAIDPATGRLVSAAVGGKRLALADGPRILGGEAKLTGIRHGAEADGYTVEARYDGALKQVRWQMQGNGWLRLDYAYENPGRRDYLGVTFDLPEPHVTGLRWVGRGPYRVWKNRLQGMEYDLWEKAYNDTRTGADWVYPEFKGHHANLIWATVQTTEAPITIVSATEDLFLRLLTPSYGPNPQFTAVAFPEGDLSFLHGIAPIGTKFHKAADLGPQSQPNEAAGQSRTQNMGRYEASLYFYFGDLHP